MVIIDLGGFRGGGGFRGDRGGFGGNRGGTVSITVVGKQGLDWRVSKFEDLSAYFGDKTSPKSDNEMIDS